MTGSPASFAYVFGRDADGTVRQVGSGVFSWAVDYARSVVSTTGGADGLPLSAFVSYTSDPEAHAPAFDTAGEAA